MKNKFVNLMLCILCALSCTSFLGGQESPINQNKIVVAVKTAVNEDNISNTDLGKLYSLYKGSYYYAQDFKFGTDVDFGPVFDKQRAIADKLKIQKYSKLAGKVNELMAKYKELPFDDDSKNQFAEEMNYISLGIKAGID